MGSLSSQVSSGSHLSQTTSTQKCISPLPPLLLSWPLPPPLMPHLSSPLLLPLPVPPPPSPQPPLLPLASWEELSSSRDWSWALPFCPAVESVPLRTTMLSSLEQCRTRFMLQA